jgi:hypothetical protein
MKHRDTDIRELTLEQQLERMTQQRNALAVFIEDWTYRLSGEQSIENCIVHPAVTIRRAIESLQDVLPNLELAEPLPEELTSRGVSKALKEIVGSPYQTEGYNPFTDDTNPNWVKS